MQVHSEMLAVYDYYPFGLTFDDPVQQVTQPKNFYLYNGKEFQEETEWYDFGFRMYDPVIGRFPSVDPIIERFPYLTPYNYASNNPVTNIDLWGLQGTSANTIRGKVVKNVKAVGEGFSQLADVMIDDAQKLLDAGTEIIEKYKDDGPANFDTDSKFTAEDGIMFTNDNKNSEIHTEGTGIKSNSISGIEDASQMQNGAAGSNPSNIYDQAQNADKMLK